MTDLKRAERMIENAKRELEVIFSAQPGKADAEEFQRVFEMLRELATDNDPRRELGGFV